MPRNLIFILLLFILAVISSILLPFQIYAWLGERLPVFTTIFLGIFIEAVPFLMLGTLGSGFVEVFVDKEKLHRLMPRNHIVAALTGSLFGLVFPVCECGVVPLTRRLFRKGMPVSMGIAFLLAAPIINPIVIFSTASAFGWGKILFMRLGFCLVIAATVGVLFSVEKSSLAVLQPESGRLQPGQPNPVVRRKSSKKQRRDPLILAAQLLQMIEVSTDDFFEMGRYLVFGAALAAALQTLIPQSILLSIGQGAITSVLVMILLAVILSVCSTVDSFIALGFAGTFSTGSILAFLVFGPMVDIKSILMYSRVFRRRAVAYLVLLPLLMSILAGVFVNFYVP